MQKIIENRFTIEPNSGCWLWLEGLDSSGYGRLTFNSKRVQAHRFLYESILSVKIPEGLQLDHLCRTRSCVNPSHLEPVTQRENIRRGQVGKWARPDICKRGHDISGAGADIFSKSGGKYLVRQCKECVKIRSIKHKNKIKEVSNGKL